MKASEERASILLVREEDSQLTGSGCCGKLEGDCARFGDTLVFPESRHIMEEFGKLSETLRRELGAGIEINLVDPRNQLYLWPKLVRDVWRYRPPLGPALRTLLMVFSIPAVIVNGQVVASRRLPNVKEFIEKIRTLVTVPSSARRFGIDSKRVETA